MSQVVWLDTETTGLDPLKNGIVELGAIIKGNPTKQFERVCNPGDVEFSEQALKVNGISMEEILSRPPIEEMLREFDQHVPNRAMIAGHNVAGFDIPFLKAAYERAGMEWRFHYHCLDTMVLANWMKHFGMLETRSVSLQALATRFGIDPGEAHRALSDVRTTRALAFELRSLMFGDRKVSV